MQPPSLRDLPDELRDASLWVAERLQSAGFQAWAVGGAVRDLVLGEDVGDVDIATDALPDQVEALFEHTTAVGKAFGTIVVHRSDHADSRRGGADSKRRGIDMEVTTFRSDGAYLDGRHPEKVTYGSSVEEDAQRRDFTCNALYLDPVSDRFLDPEHGLADLRAGRLRCVGEARARFAEDGLRLLRLARFEARFGLEPDRETLEGACASRQALASVSSERVLAELRGLFASPRPAIGFSRLAELELWNLALVGFEGVLRSEESWRSRVDLLLTALGSLGGPLPLELGLALLFEVDPAGSLSEADWVAARERADGALDHFHPSRKERRAVQGIWEARRELRRLLDTGTALRSQRIRLLRREAWPLAERASRAWLAAGVDASSAAAALARLDELSSERSNCSRDELSPKPLLSAQDLSAAGLAPGPRFGELLREAETRQLDRLLTDRAAALEWLAQQVRAH